MDSEDKQQALMNLGYTLDDLVNYFRYRDVLQTGKFMRLSMKTRKYEEERPTDSISRRRAEIMLKGKRRRSHCPDCPDCLCNFGRLRMLRKDEDKLNMLCIAAEAEIANRTTHACTQTDPFDLSETLQKTRDDDRAGKKEEHYEGVGLEEKRSQCIAEDVGEPVLPHLRRLTCADGTKGWDVLEKSWRPIPFSKDFLTARSVALQRTMDTPQWSTLTHCEDALTALRFLKGGLEDSQCPLHVRFLALTRLQDGLSALASKGNVVNLVHEGAMDVLLRVVVEHDWDVANESAVSSMSVIACNLPLGGVVDGIVESNTMNTFVHLIKRGIKTSNKLQGARMLMRTICSLFARCSDAAKETLLLQSPTFMGTIVDAVRQTSRSRSSAAYVEDVLGVVQIFCNGSCSRTVALFEKGVVQNIEHIVCNLIMPLSSSPVNRNLFKTAFCTLATFAQNVRENSFYSTFLAQTCKKLYTVLADRLQDEGDQTRRTVGEAYQWEMRRAIVGVS